MADITAAVTLGRAGETDTARLLLGELWERIGPVGDALHRCTLAHYLADLYDDPAEALVWDVRALDAAKALTDDRAQRYHDSLRVAGFFPSLHLNLADDFRRLGSFTVARDHLTAARDQEHTLGNDEYGALIRQAISEVEEAIERRSTTRRATAPGPGGR
ncbi:hypothetical protein [Amycolatopsis pigmentata]|uniref:Tetratricopeptide repeat protein n=1 Tax=Amycolatopsis pigmentata TaxID=450801 RepID=A0ABW5G0P7_9PSEU